MTPPARALLWPILLLLLLLAGCSGGASDSADSGADSGGDSGAGSDAGPGVSAPAEAGEDRALSEQSGDGSGEDAAESGDRDAARSGVDVTRAVISTGTVSLWAREADGGVGTVRREVQRLLDAERGVVTEEDTDTEDGQVVYTRMVVRVPAARFEAAMSALEEVAELRGSTRGSEDVTAEVIDVDARVRAQQASLRRVERLLGEATSMRDVISIEGELTRRQGDLDSLAGRQRWLADQTAMSTITVDVERPPSRVEEDEADPSGFLDGLRGGLSALGATAATVATLLGALLPFAVVLAVVGLPGWVVVRRLARRRAGRPDHAAGPAEG